MGKEYVDMGLPSGTLWASENEEGYFTFDEAVEKFGNSLPARWQFCELAENCDCVFDIEKRALICKSKFNGNTIEFPALGCRYDTGGPDSFGDIGFYWSCTPCSDSRTFVWYFRFHNYDKYGPIHFCARYFGQSVRLCKLERSGIK